MASRGKPSKYRRRVSPAGQFRIIGGAWRGRRFPVPGDADVRPTPDRVRETVFNWLAPVIAGASCLDLYAGSGALGLEALSRGAGRVVFVDRSPVVLRHLTATLQGLGAAAGETVAMDAMSYLEGPPVRFDIVFLDPPYRQGLLAPVMARLVDRGWLSAAPSIYIEHEAEAPVPTPPPGWRLFRSAAAGRVRYHLVRPEPRQAVAP
jgi:16S rRNA (guanine966-N2)-methyltransferase